MNLDIPVISNKIASSFEDAGLIVQLWKEKGERIVFTNGCFDLLHIGHIHTLYKSKEFGSKLIVGLNADISVTRLKGDHRPIKNEYQRSAILAAFEVVDLVVIFSEDTPEKLIESICPDVLAKGGDWALDQILGSEFVIKNGGEVKQIPYLKGFSTTLLEQKMKLQNDESKTS